MTVQEIVFIDGGLPDVDTLRNGVRPGVEVVVLDPNEDGLTQIIRALAGRSTPGSFDAIHLISHGSSGALHLGATVLTGAVLDNYAAQLAALGQALAPGGDLLLYGCDVAQGAAGREFIERLAQLTGGDVAASDDPTGASILGGDWLLEASAGSVETGVVMRPEAADRYAATLPANTAPTFVVGDGKVLTAVGSGDDIGRSLAIQTDGRIIVAGQAFNGTDNDFTLVRYNADGSLDTSFDGDGIVTTPLGSGSDTAYGVVVQSDGKIVVAGLDSGGADNDFAVVRYNANGSLDTTFDGDGWVTTNFSSGSSDNCYAVAIQSDGRILVGGQGYNGSNYRFSLVRYNSNRLLKFDPV